MIIKVHVPQYHLELHSVKGVFQRRAFGINCSSSNMNALQPSKLRHNNYVSQNNLISAVHKSFQL